MWSTPWKGWGLNSVLEKVSVFLFLPLIFFMAFLQQRGYRQAVDEVLCGLWTDKYRLWSMTWQTQRELSPLLTFLIYSSTEVPSYDPKFRIKTLNSWKKIESTGTSAPKENLYCRQVGNLFLVDSVQTLFSAKWCWVIYKETTWCRI